MRRPHHDTAYWMCGKARDSRWQTAAYAGAEATCSRCVDLCQRDLQLQAHPREVASFSHWRPGETHEEALARPARFATNSFACLAAKVCWDLCCQQCPNSHRDRRSAEQFSVKTRLIVRRHTCHGRSWQWHASASCSLYISAQGMDYLQPLDLQGFPPFKQYLKRKHQESRSYSEHGLVLPLAWLWQCMQAPHEFWAAGKGTKASGQWAAMAQVKCTKSFNT